MINYTSCRWNDNNKQKRILKSCWQTKKIMINYSGCRKTTEILEKRKIKKLLTSDCKWDIINKLSQRDSKRNIDNWTATIPENSKTKFSERTLLIRVIEANDFQNNSNGWMANVILTEQTLLTRVWSWLRMNAGGVLNTCKSNEALKTDFFGMKTFVTEWRTGE